MADNKSYIALDWINDEIADTLKQAVESLEAFVKNPSDVTKLRFCMTYTFQASGSLKMIELHSPAQLSVELETLLSKALDEKDAELRKSQAGIVQKGLLVLVDYLSQVAKTHTENPNDLLPILNEVRTALKEEAVTASDLYNPELSDQEPNQTQEVSIGEEEFDELIRKLRQSFQSGLIGVVRNSELDKNFNIINKVSTKLESVSEKTASHGFWEIAAALTESLLLQDKEANIDAKKALKQIDNQLKQLHDSGREVLNQAVDNAFIKTLLYSVATDEQPTHKIIALREKYQLQESVEQKQQQSLQERLFQQISASVLASLAQDNLEQACIRTTELLVGDVVDIADIESRLSETNINLDAFIARLDLLLSENRERLESVKERIVEYVATQWDRNAIVALPDLLNDTITELDYTCFTALQPLLETVIGYLNKELLCDNEQQTDITQIETLADIISSVEYYLECFSSQALQQLSNILNVAEESMLSLVSEKTEANDVEVGSKPSDLELDIDEDILEIFFEEAEEVLDNINEFLPLLSEDLSNKVAIDEILRAFHTLRGSGRIVGLDGIADFAGAIEQMLSKVVEGRATLTENAFSITSQAVALIPEFLGCFEKKKAMDQASFDEVVHLANTEWASEVVVETTTADKSTPDDVSDADSLEDIRDIDVSEIITDEDLVLDLDEEIFEIFVEEAEEVLEAIQEYLPKVELDGSDSASLTEVRRAYHTLKGSGRMVGATDIGEFAWSVERMLNKIMDAGLALDAYPLYIVKRATALISAFVGCFEQKKIAKSTIIDEVIARADAHWAGEEYVAVIADDAVEHIDIAEDVTLEVQAEDAVESSGTTEIEESVVSENAEIEAVVEDDGDDDELNELIEIFVAEARTHIDVLALFLEEIDPGYSDIEISHDLQRAFHTLKGSAQMADMQDMAAIASPLEDLIKDLANFQVKADAEVLVLLMRANELLNESLVAIEQGEIVPRERISSFVEDAEALHKEKINGTNDDANDESEDKQLEILTQALECLTIAADINSRWQTDAQSITADDKSQLTDSLSQLASTADNANYPDVASLADALSAFYSKAIVDEISDECLTAFFDLANSAHDELDDMLDFVAANQKVEPATVIIGKLIDFNVSDTAETQSASSDVVTPKVASAVDTSVSVSVNAQAFAQQLMAADEEMLDIFLEEANELYEELEQFFADWLNDRSNKTIAHGIMRVLHTLKGGARLAELTELGDIVHNYETVIERCELKGEFDDAFFNDLKVYQLGIEKLMALSEKSPEQILSECEHDGAVAQASEAEVEDESPSASLEVESDDSCDNHADIFAGLAVEVAAADEETLEIFIEEATELTEELEEAANSWIDDHSKVDSAASLKRVLHTLKGGARLTEIKILGDLTHDYESMIEKHEFSSDFSAEFFTQLADYQAKVNKAIEILVAGAPKAAPQPAMTLTQSAIITAPEPVDLSTIETSLNIHVEDLDSELLSLFVDESTEHLESIEAATALLLSGGNQKYALDELKRVLHTLKGGARLAGVTDIGDVSHDFETYIINAEREGLANSPDFIDEIQGYQDNLGNLTQEVQRLADLTSKASRQELIQSNVVPIRAGIEAQEVNQAAIDATRSFIESLNKDKSRGNKEAIKLLPEQLQGMINLAGENLISRSRIEEVMSEMGFSLDEMDSTVDRLHGQLRRMEIETEAQMTSRYEQMEVAGQESFDPLEMDRYSSMQQLSKLLIESASDLEDLSDTINNKMRDMETILLQMGRINNGLQESLMRAQMVPFSKMVPRLHRIIRQISGELGKKIDFSVENAEGELDRTILDKMITPLEHMLRNAVDHGIEMPADRIKAGKPELGNIVLSVSREGGEVVLTLQDNGAGVNIDAVRKKAIERGLMKEDSDLSENEIAQFIMHAGFSTAEKVTQISGRGVGMDVVHSEIKQMGGVVEIESHQGLGTKFIVRLPFTVSVNRALMVTMGGSTYAIPLNTIDGIVRVSPYELEAYYQPDAPLFEYAGQNYKLKYMGSLLQRGKSANLEGKTTPLPVILIRSSDYSVAVQVDQLLGSQEVVVKSLGPQFSMVEGVSGATVMGNGDVVVILDMLALIREEGQRNTDEFSDLVGIGEQEHEKERPLKVMVTDDSVTVRKVTSRFLERQGFEVVLAKDGQDAVTQLSEMAELPDLMLLDIEMPRMDGFEVLSRVRHNAKLQHIHIVMITSRTGEKHRDRALSLGASRYLGKPFQENELLQVIGELTGAEVLEA